MSVCLDSWAVLAWLDGDEPAAGAVQAALDAEWYLRDTPLPLEALTDTAAAAS